MISLVNGMRSDLVRRESDDINRILRNIPPRFQQWQLSRWMELGNKKYLMNFSLLDYLGLYIIKTILATVEMWKPGRVQRMKIFNM